MVNNYFEINKLSFLHKKKNILFCKTDFLSAEFDTIEKLDHDVILITGNSDYSITDELVSIAPKNITKWYAQNALSLSPILHPIPIGLENKFISYRDGHGVYYYDRASIKEKLLNSNLSINDANKLIYANFNIYTNYGYRSEVKYFCESSNFIHWEEPSLSLEIFFQKMSEYKMVVCPAGNGVDTHRLWEVLYMNRIPITIKVGNYNIYSLYEKLPIIILDSIDELLNYNLIMQKYDECINKKWDNRLLDVEFWKTQIMNS